MTSVDRSLLSFLSPFHSFLHPSIQRHFTQSPCIVPDSGLSVEDTVKQAPSQPSMGSVFGGRDTCLSKCLWTKCCDWDEHWLLWLIRSDFYFNHLLSPVAEMDWLGSQAFASGLMAAWLRPLALLPVSLKKQIQEILPANYKHCISFLPQGSTVSRPFLPQDLAFPKAMQGCLWIDIWITSNLDTHSDLGVLFHTCNPNTSQVRQ